MICSEESGVWFVKIVLGVALFAAGIHSVLSNNVTRCNNLKAEMPIRGDRNAAVAQCYTLSAHVINDSPSDQVWPSCDRLYSYVRCHTELYRSSVAGLTSDPVQVGWSIRVTGAREHHVVTQMIVCAKSVSPSPATEMICDRTRDEPM